MEGARFAFHRKSCDSYDVSEAFLFLTFGFAFFAFSQGIAGHVAYTAIGSAIGAFSVLGFHWFRDRRRILYARQRRRRIESGDLTALNEPEEYEGYESSAPTEEERAALPGRIVNTSMIGGAFGLAFSIGNIDNSNFIVSIASAISLVGAAIWGMAKLRRSEESDDIRKAELRKGVLEIVWAVILFVFAGALWFTSLEQGSANHSALAQNYWFSPIFVFVDAYLFSLIIPLVMMAAAVATFWAKPDAESADDVGYLESIEGDPHLGYQVMAAVLFFVGAAMLVSQNL